MRREPGLEHGSMPVRLLRTLVDTARYTHTVWDGRWPMVAPGGGVECYAALRCRLARDTCR
eukprot:4478051-Prymnesium_polylepis.1